MFNLTNFLSVDFDLTLQRYVVGSVGELFLQHPNVLPNAQRVLLTFKAVEHFKVNGNGVAEPLAFARLQSDGQIVALRDLFLVADELRC